MGQGSVYVCMEVVKHVGMKRGGRREDREWGYVFVGGGRGGRGEDMGQGCVYVCMMVVIHVG